MQTESAATERSTPLLDLSNVSKRFGGVQALQSVSFAIDPGEVVCLAGENGCGKSTLIKIISGVHAPEPGARMLFDGQPVDGLTPAAARNMGIQVIWQDLALFGHMSVAENIAFESHLGGPRLIKGSAMRRRASEILDRLGVDLKLDTPVRRLSIAERQLVAIARALVADARLVFMDEPTASLTRAETNALLDIVRRLSQDGIAVVFVSHRLAEVLDIATRVTVLRDGKYVGAFPTEGMTQNRLTELMTGGTFDDVVHAGRATLGEPVLSVRDLRCAGDYEDISFDIRRGEILGLTGRLGAGRTELALSLFGMNRPQGGTVHLDGKPLDLRSNRDAIDAGIAYVSEDRLSLGLVQQQSIASNIEVTVLDRVVNRFGLLSPPKQAEVVQGWMQRLAVKAGDPSDAVSTLSGGNQQRVVLAKWLAIRPRVLLLDSPTVGVDVGARAGIFEIVRELAAEGMAILLISDEAPEVYYNSDRILHMRDGRLVAEYVPGDVTLDQLEAAVHE